MQVCESCVEHCGPAFHEQLAASALIKRIRDIVVDPDNVRVRSCSGFHNHLHPTAVGFGIVDNAGESSPQPHRWVLTDVNIMNKHRGVWVHQKSPCRVIRKSFTR